MIFRPFDDCDLGCASSLFGCALLAGAAADAFGLSAAMEIVAMVACL